MVLVKYAPLFVLLATITSYLVVCALHYGRAATTGEAWDFMRAWYKASPAECLRFGAAVVGSGLLGALLASMPLT